MYVPENINNKRLSNQFDIKKLRTKQNCTPVDRFDLNIKTSKAKIHDKNGNVMETVNFLKPFIRSINQVAMENGEDQVAKQLSSISVQDQKLI